jgi:DNA-directed RNA polymerase I, II, and III subunit RPABC2
MNTKYNEKENNILEEDSDVEEGDEEKEVVIDLENEDEDDDIEDDDGDGEMDMDYLETRENEKDRQHTSSFSKMIEDEYSEGDVETDDDSVEEEEVDENYLQKFNENINIKILENMHPEIKSVNYEEMIALARVIRDKNGRIIDPLHKTIPFLTKYERARIIGTRAEQLDAGGEAYIPLDETIVNGKTIALMEFEAKKIPFIISRPLPNGSTEYWHVSDLEYILD